MRVIAIRTLREYWTRYADAEGPLKAWMADAERAAWQTPQDIKANYASASILGNDRVVFNIKGNTYRLIVWVQYAFETVYVKWFGTHADYDKIDALTINLPPPQLKAHGTQATLKEDEEL